MIFTTTRFATTHSRYPKTILCPFRESITESQQTFVADFDWVANWFPQNRPKLYGIPLRRVTYDSLMDKSSNCQLLAELQ